MYYGSHQAQDSHLDIFIYVKPRNIQTPQVLEHQEQGLFVVELGVKDDVVQCYLSAVADGEDDRGRVDPY